MKTAFVTVLLAAGLAAPGTVVARQGEKPAASGKFTSKNISFAVRGGYAFHSESSLGKDPIIDVVISNDDVPATGRSRIAVRKECAVERMQQEKSSSKTTGCVPMTDKIEVAAAIRAAFAATPYPGDAFLVGSPEGCEPEDEVGPFREQVDRDRLEPAFLDGHYCALSFFSEGAFRYFLPAYLLADLDGRLMTADPLFHLTGGFADLSTRVEAAGRLFTRHSGRTAFINPRRYGAMTSGDYARFRLSVFPREEAAAIVAYLEYKRALDPTSVERLAIDASLELFWRERSRTAPTAADLATRLADDETYFAALRGERGNR